MITFSWKDLQNLAFTDIRSFPHGPPHLFHSNTLYPPSAPAVPGCLLRSPAAALSPWPTAVFLDGAYSRFQQLQQRGQTPLAPLQPYTLWWSSVFCSITWVCHSGWGSVSWISLAGILGSYWPLSHEGHGIGEQQWLDLLGQPQQDSDTVWHSVLSIPLKLLQPLFILFLKYTKPTPISRPLTYCLPLFPLSNGLLQIFPCLCPYHCISLGSNVTSSEKPSLVILSKVASLPDGHPTPTSHSISHHCFIFFIARITLWYYHIYWFTFWSSVSPTRI